jgi:PAS domain S-box-containing protein
LGADMPLSEQMTTARLGEIVEKAAAEVFIFGKDDFHFLLVNQGARENLGYSREELADLHPWDVKPEYSETEFKNFVGPLIDGTKSQLYFETLHQRKDGSCYDVSVRLQLISDSGLPVFYAAIQDITEQRRTRRELEEVSWRLDAILNNTTMAVFMMDEEQRCSFMNTAAERLTGFSFEETQGRTLHEVVHHTRPDGSPFPIGECPIDRAFPENSQTQGEEVFVHKDGTFYNVAFTASPMKNAAGLSIGTVIEARNIDEELKAREALNSFNDSLRQKVDEALAQRKALEDQLFQAQKMEAIGQLTGGVAHDFNNLLQVIGGNLQLLKQDPILDRRNIARINNALSGVERGAKLAAQLLAFGRQQPLKPVPVNAGRILRDMDDMLRRTLDETVEIETIVAAGLWNCLVDPRQLENVLLNLAINARDAMKGEGKLTLEVGNASMDEAYLSLHPGASAGQYVMIAVTDTGCGIPEEHLAKVFEPFFTTKPPGEGTGLGLSMVFGFVKQSGGHVTIYSEEGEGTTVRIYLPRTREAEMPNRPEGNTMIELGNNEVVLVVEDDADVRATAVEMLTNLGYRVIEAGNADSALAILQCGIAIDLLFTDVVMPGKLRSPELARLAKELLPDIAILFTSGHTQNAIVHDGRLDDDVELISKPYSSERLSLKVKRVLDSRGKTAPAQGPVVPSANVSLADTTSAVAGPGRVLLVEDEPLIRMATADAMEAWGWTVTEAGTLKEATELLASQQFEAIVSDLGLPDGEVTQFLLEIRATRPAMKVILATGSHAPEELQPQDIAVLTKPFSDHELKAALER